MDPCSLNFQVETFETASRQECCRLFSFYHPHYQSGCPTCRDDHYTSFILDERENPGELAHHPTNLPVCFDQRGGYVALSTLGTIVYDQLFTQHAATIPPEKMSAYSELMPHVASNKTTVSLKRDVRVATQPQPCVSPALCQGYADLPECSGTDDELDCPGEPACDLEFESSYEEEEGEQSHPPPPPSPYSTPSPPPSPSPSANRYGSSRTSHAIRSARGKSRYSPMEVRAPSRKKKSVAKRVSCGSDDEKPKKSKKPREAVNLACHFCRRRKIACRQPPLGSLDRTCNQCKTRGMKCEYPTESRRGAHRGSANSHKHGH